MEDFEKIYSEYFDVVYHYVLSLCLNESLAEEITQEAFFKALKNIGSFRGDCKVNVWLCQIAKNIYYTERKRKAKKLENEVVTGPEKENLLDIIFILQTIYNNSGQDTGVSDYDYDRLYELLNNSGEELISSSIVTGPKGFHKYPTLRGTLKKVYVLDENDIAANESRASLSDWVKGCEKIIYDATGKHVNLWEEWIYVFPKWDGVSVEFEFDENNNLVRALTRGNTETNEATIVTAIFMPIQSRIKEPAMRGQAYGLKTETMVHDYDLEGYNERYHTEYKSTRSIASSSCSSLISVLFSLTVKMAASFRTFSRSAPEKPGVLLAKAARSISLDSFLLRA